ncbi:MAG: hypothetical protein ACSLE0_23310 [Chitinophagaceae bacterium]
MDKTDRIKVKNLMAKMAQKYKLPLDVIEKIINSPYWFTYEQLKDYNLDEMSVEEAKALKTNFNYKGLGKLYLNPPSLKVRQQRRKDALKINKSNGRSKECNA